MRRLRDGEVLADAASRRRRRRARRRQLLAARAAGRPRRRARLPVAAPPGGQTASAHDARRRRVRRDAETKTPTELLVRRRRRRPLAPVPDTTLSVLGRDGRHNSDNGPRNQLERARHVYHSAQFLPRRGRHDRLLTAFTVTLLPRPPVAKGTVLTAVCLYVCEHDNSK